MFTEEENNPKLKNWLSWWDRRRRHISEAFRPPNCPNTNLAEAAHASMQLRGGSDISIIDCAVFDVSDAFEHASMVKSYQMGTCKAGRGQSIAAMERTQQMKSSARSEKLIEEVESQFVNQSAPPVNPSAP